MDLREGPDRGPVVSADPEAWVGVQPRGSDPVPADEAWAALEAIPGFSEGLRESEAELEAGGGVTLDVDCGCGAEGCTAWEPETGGEG
jgi:hypothetical protein